MIRTKGIGVYKPTLKIQKSTVGMTCLSFPYWKLLAGWVGTGLVHSLGGNPAKWSLWDLNSNLVQLLEFSYWMDIVLDYRDDDYIVEYVLPESPNMFHKGQNGRYNECLYVLEKCSCVFCTYPSETGGKGAGHNLWKNDIARGHNINQLESNGSKMADKSTLTRPWSSISKLNDTPRGLMTVPRHHQKTKKWVVAQFL